MQNIILQNEAVLLRKMTLEDTQAIADIAMDERIWTYTQYTVENSTDVQNYVKSVLASSLDGSQYPFVIIDRHTNKIVGSTRYYNIDSVNKRLELGYTWITPSYWRTNINTNCKYLLLEYCFEQLGYHRLQLAADERNIRSCTAMKRIGAIQEATLRKHMICKDGYHRNSVIFSFIDDVWVETKLHIQSLLK